MPGLKLVREDTASRPPDIQSAGDSTALFRQSGGTFLPAGAYSQGDALVMRCRRAAALINATTGGNQVPWEGPYLRIRPRREPGVVWNASPNDTDNYQVMVGGVPTNQNCIGDEDFYYDIDANQAIPIVFPFDAEVSLYTERSGIWVYDPLVFKCRKDGSPSFRPDGGAREYEQTRIMSPNGGDIVSRSLIVPNGAVSFKVIGELVADSIQWQRDDAGTVDVSGATITRDVSYEITNRDEYPIAGARRILLRTLAMTNYWGIVFKIRLG